MKIGNFFRTACKAMALAVVAFPMFVSCYDDKALIQDMENMKSDISALEERVAKIEKDLKDQVSGLQTLIGNVEKSLKFSVEQLGGKVDGNYESLSDMIAALDKKYGDFASTFQTTLQGLVTVKNVKTNADGSVTVTLSDMTQFVVYPKHVDPYKNVVTTIVIDGVIYWAQYVDGNVVPFTDAEGNNIPVVPEGDNLVTPEFKVEEGYIWISFDGGANWDKTGIADSDATIFQDAEINYTEVDPNDYWGYPEPETVTLTLADGTTVTLTVDGYAALEFNYPSLWVAAGSTNSVPLYANGITNYIVEISNGWTYEEIQDNYRGTVFKVTAPSAEAIASGIAPADGLIKVLGVAEGGKAFSTTLKLTTQPFETFAYNDNAFTIVPNGGLEQYIYGVCKLDEFDPDAIYAGVKAYWDAVKDEDWSARLPEGASRGYGEDETPAADLLGSELEPGVKYIMWTLPCVYETFIVEWDGQEYEEGTYTVYENSFVNKEFMLQDIKCETNKLSFNELDITVTVNGIDQYFAGFDTLEGEPAEQLEYALEEINYFASAGNAIYMVKDNPGKPYTGSPWGFVEDYGDILPGTSYMLYIIPYVEGKTEYSIEDVKYWEWTTDPLIAGGSINVVPGEATATYNNISVPLTADGASMVYWKFVEPKYVSANTVDELIQSGNIFAGSEGEATEYNLSAGTTMTLLAVAVDAEGCYGEMLVKEFSTNPLSYNDITIGIELLSTTDTEAIVKVTPSSETATLKYYYAEENYYMWNYFGTDKAAISEACQLNSTVKWSLKNMTLTDGTFKMTGLELGSRYRLAVVAIETDGTYSMAEVFEFEIKVNLGEFVRAVDPMTGEANPLWEAAKPVFEGVKVENVGDDLSVTWDLTVPSGFEVVATRCISPEYLASYVSPEDKVRYLIGNASLVDNTEYIETIGDFDENDMWVEYPVENPYWTAHWQSAGNIIYVVIKDAQGNYYEAYEHDPKISGGSGFGQ